MKLLTSDKQRKGSLLKMVKAVSKLLALVFFYIENAFDVASPR